MFKKLVIVFCLLTILAIAAGAGAVVYGYHYFSRDLPQIDAVEDYRMQSVSSILASDGTIVALDGEKVVGVGIGVLLNIDFDNLPSISLIVLVDDETMRRRRRRHWQP